MRPKEGFAKLTIYIPKPQYDQLVQRKLINGQSISSTVTEVLERHRTD